MERRTLGGLEVSAQGLGCMGMSAFYGTTDEAEALATVDRAIALGITFLDTAEMYGPYTNEELLGKALKGRRDEVEVATKFGIRFDPTDDEPMRRVADGSPENVRRSIEGSLRRLGMDHVDLFYLHRVDPGTPIEETVGAMAELVREGKVGHIGLSEAAPDTIRRAHATHPIAALQTEYSLWSRDPEAEIEEGDFRRANPRFQGANWDANQAIVAKIREIAEERGCTPAQLALAWVSAQGEDMVPIPGTKRRTYLEDNAAAADVALTAGDLGRIDAELPEPAGDRYDASGMRSVGL